jgi:hypothetical protein
MEFDLAQAIIAGVVGTAVMTAVLYVGFLMGMRMDMPMMLGTMMLPKGPPAWAAGLVMHFGAGIVFFIAYGLLFDAFGISETIAGWGAIFGLVHGFVAGMALGMMPVMHPRIAASSAGESSETLPAPGFFGLNVSAMAPVAILLLHVIYGAAGGAVYSA